MKNPLSQSEPLPPRLTMDEYMDFVSASCRACDPEAAKRQKEFEERIKQPFRIPEDHRE